MSKGDDFENRVCRLLSRAQGIQDVKSVHKLPFRRLSTAVPPVDGYRNAGDIQYAMTLGLSVSIECKSYKSVTLGHVVEGDTKQMQAFWTQTQVQAKGNPAWLFVCIPRRGLAMCYRAVWNNTQTKHNDRRLMDSLLKLASIRCHIDYTEKRKSLFMYNRVLFFEV